MAGVDWGLVRLTEHMTEAAVVVGECQVVVDFGPPEQACYEVKVFRSLKGPSTARFFALATNRDDRSAFQPVGNGASAEEALQDCLENAGVHHRRRVERAGR